jgi:hypothetical protein
MNYYTRTIGKDLETQVSQDKIVIAVLFTITFIRPTEYSNFWTDYIRTRTHDLFLSLHIHIYIFLFCDSGSSECTTTVTTHENQTS